MKKNFIRFLVLTCLIGILGIVISADSFADCYSEVSVTYQNCASSCSDIDFANGDVVFCLSNCGISFMEGNSYCSLTEVNNLFVNNP